MFKIEKKRFIAIILITVIITAGVLAGGFLIYADINDITFISGKEYKTMKDISDRYGKLYIIDKKLDEEFLWDIDKDKQAEIVYKALLAGLGDEYSLYMTAEEFEQWMSYVEGTFTGIGIVFGPDNDNNMEIKSVMKDSPAESAGLKEGDFIIAVDGKKYKTSNELRDVIRGEEGTTVNITVERNGKNKDFDIVRANVTEQSVLAKKIDDEYGYIRITSFDQKTAEQFKTELSALERSGAKGFVLDLRDNPGGLVDEGIDIADILLPESTITHTENKKGKKEFYNSDEKCTKLKYAVLINKNTASTSEILAAAIQGNKAAPIIGTKSFGKGIIQTTLGLTDGSAIKFTTMQYFSPENKAIHNKGVEPDIVVEQKKGDKIDAPLEAALKELKK